MQHKSYFLTEGKSYDATWFRYNYDSILNADYDYFTYLNMNEMAAHLLFSSRNNPYPYILKHITDIIIKADNDKSNYNCQLYKNLDVQYMSFEFLNPFRNLSGLDAISKLKIYVSKNNKEFDAFNISSKLDADYMNQFNADELPLFKSDGTTVQCISIIINCDKQGFTYPTIFDTLAHEMRHAVEYIKNEKLARYTGEYDAIREMIDAFANTYNQEPRYVIRLYNLFNDLVYYTQDTEISAHLENAINELYDSNICRNDALLLAKHISYVYPFPGNVTFKKLGFQHTISASIPMQSTLITYCKLLYHTTDDEMFDYYSPLYVEHLKNILDAHSIKYNSDEEVYSKFQKLIDKYRTKLQEFITKYQKAIYVQYEK